MISGVVPEPRAFLITVSASDPPAVNPNSIKTLLANCMITFFINAKPTCINGPRSLPRNS